MLGIFLLSFLFLFSLILFFVITTSFLGYLQTRVPYAGTIDEDVKYVVKKASIKPSDTFYDLGSGDGKVVFLVEKLTGAAAKGFELTYWMYLFALFKKFLKGSKAQFSHSDFFKSDWSEATVIYCYLFPPVMAHIEEKLKENCKPGTTVICRDFFLPHLKPEAVLSPNKHKLFFYRV